jgi:glycine/D-amino acid oxidase-like deaminating enzyme
MTKPVQRIVVMGGGSAGWLTASLLAAEHHSTRPDGLQVTLVESPQVPAIGVGEGTWPSMRDTLQRIGVAEADFMVACNAAFKQGSKFVGWVSGAAQDYYYHPFMLPQGYFDANLVAGWQAQSGSLSFADLVCAQPHLCEQSRAPKQFTTPGYSAVANYGYHLDAVKFGQFLAQHATTRLGVRHLQDHVVSVESLPDGDIAALVTANQGRLEADLFIDCSGLRSQLLGEHFGVPLISLSDVLLNDRAVASQVPYAQATARVASQTISTAQQSGWIWDIGLPTRRGVGYTYSSQHATDDQAEQTLRAYLRGSGAPDPESVAVRRIAFQPGHRAHFWHRNCVAVGLSAGFIEPLEASALALVEMSASLISAELPATRAAMDIVARRFNDSFIYRWQRIVDFLKLHYVLSQRTDRYWQDQRAQTSIPAHLAELLTLWAHRPPSRIDFPNIEEVFPAASYQYVLYGMGFQPQTRPTSRRADDPLAAEHFFRETAAQRQRLLSGLPGHRELLDYLHAQQRPAA